MPRCPALHVDSGDRAQVLMLMRQALYQTPCLSRRTGDVTVTRQPDFVPGGIALPLFLFHLQSAHSPRAREWHQSCNQDTEKKISFFSFGFISFVFSSLDSSLG